MIDMGSFLGHLGGGTPADADLVAPFALPVVILLIFGVSAWFHDKKRRRGAMYLGAASAIGVSAIILIPILATPPVTALGTINVANTQLYVTPSVFVQEYSVPTPNARPHAIAVDAQGKIWFAMNGKGKIAVFDPRATIQTFTEFTVPTVPAASTVEVWSMRIDKNGDIWFPDTVSNSIWKFDVSRNTFRQYSIPTANAFPVALVIDGNGDVWFTELNGNKIAKISSSQAATSTEKTVVEFAVPTQKSGSLGIATDAGGNIWFTETFANKIAMLDPRSGAITEYNPVLPISSPYGLSSPYGIAIDRENNVWIAEHGGSRIVRFNPQTNTVAKYAMSTNKNYPISLIESLIIDSNGNIWSNQHGANRIAKLIPSTSTLIEYNIPTGPNANVLHLAQDSDSRVWFTELTGNKLGVIKPDIPPTFGTRVDKDIVETSVNAEFTVNLQIASIEPVDLQVSSSMSYTGELKGLIAQFPSKYVPNGSTPVSIPIHFRSTEQVEPGVHSITISASTKELTQSIIITLIIKR